MATINEVKEYLKYAELANAGYVFGLDKGDRHHFLHS